MSKPMQRWVIKKIKNAPESDGEYINAEPSELFAMVWPITIDAWAFQGEQIAEQRLQRDVTNFIRRGS